MIFLSQFAVRRYSILLYIYTEYLTKAFMNDPIFLIAVLPPDEIQKEVTGFKEYALRKFNSGHALKSPPHITLQSPFRWSLKKIKSLKNELSEFANIQKPFSVELENWDHFSDRVIFLDVLPNPDLTDLQVSLAGRLFKNLRLKKDTRPFHPHMTVAHKDLKTHYFPKAWAHFSNMKYNRKFEVEEIVLLRHDGQKWENFERFGFNN